MTCSWALQSCSIFQKKVNSCLCLCSRTNGFVRLISSQVFVDHKFVDLPLDPRLQRGVAAAVGAGAHLTQVQSQTLLCSDLLQPYTDRRDQLENLSDRPPDLLLRAQTGTGKTLAFLVPTIQRLYLQLAERQREGLAMLVLAPTRELVLQLARVTASLLQYSGGHLRSSFVTGGFSLQDDVERLRADAPHILLGTPGRLVKHLRGTPNFVQAFSSIEYLVLDEADRLLDPTFIHQVDYVIRCLPIHRRPQTVLCSATFSDPVRKFAVRSLRANLQTIGLAEIHSRSGHLDTPSEDLQADGHTSVKSASMESVSGVSVASPVEQILISYRPELFLSTLRSTLEQEMKGEGGECRRVLVLFPTVRWLQFFYVLLKHHGRMSGLHALHRGLSDERRRARAAKFSRGAPSMSGALFATDLAARGLDFDVHVVMQIGPPEDQEQYIHRAGRTGRLTSAGRSILLLNTLEKDPILKELSGVSGFTEESAAPPAESKPVFHSLGNWWEDPALAASGNLFYASAIAFYLDRVDRFRVSAEAVVRTVAGLLRSTGLPDEQGLPALPRGLAARIQAKDNLLGIRTATIRERWDVLSALPAYPGFRSQPNLPASKRHASPVQPKSETKAQTRMDSRSNL
eukprot:TRINITY_DN31189_c0_g1_i1.p1 TRINITY_DN31189_c0_g1~~TRINITY_DN31189_c0_g1_i1.p1  ORF type:complete len:628 (+),score=92.72 TRINITY_DN31189_c0_g1_i1:13-1896(+)